MKRHSLLLAVLFVLVVLAPSVAASEAPLNDDLDPPVVEWFHAEGKHEALDLLEERAARGEIRLLHWRLDADQTGSDFPNDDARLRADALGIGLGALLGTAAAGLGQLRLVYGVEAVCMAGVLLLVSLNPLLDGRPLPEGLRRTWSGKSLDLSWLPPLVPVLVVSLVATSILSLQQSALPLDLVRGGLERPGLSESHSSALIALQLTLLVMLQWPVGRWLSERSVAFGLSLSLIAFALGSALIGLSALSPIGTGLVMTALLPMAFAQAAFLPTATQAVVVETPEEHRGLAMALFSQCFAMSAVVAPVIGGRLLDQQGHGLILWTLMACVCLAGVPMIRQLKHPALIGDQGSSNNLSMLK